MVKTKTSTRRKTSLRNTRHKKPSPSPAIKTGMGVDTYDPTKALLDEDKIGRAIWECLKEGDYEGVIEIIEIHLEACNKAQLAKKAHLAKTTLYHSLKNKNPTLRTLAKIVHASM